MGSVPGAQFLWGRVLSAPQALHSTTLGQACSFQAVCWRAAVPASPAPWRCAWPSRVVGVSSHTIGVALGPHDTRFLPPHWRCARPQGWQVFLMPSGFMASLTQPAGFSASLAMRCFPWGKRISLFPAPSPRCHYLRSITVFFASEAMRSALWAERFSRNCPFVLSTPKAIFPPPLSICFPLGRAGSLVPTSTLIIATCARSRFLHLQSDALGNHGRVVYPASNFWRLPPPVGSLLRLVRRHAQFSGPASGFLWPPLGVVFRLDNFCHLGDELPMGGALHFPASTPFGIVCLRRSAVLRHYGNTLGPSGPGDSFTFLPFGIASSA